MAYSIRIARSDCLSEAAVAEVVSLFLTSTFMGWRWIGELEQEDCWCCSLYLPPGN
jgi:hypothetical protein